MTRQELFEHYQAQLLSLAKELVDDRELEASQRAITAARQIDELLDELHAGGIEERAVRVHLVEPWHFTAEFERLAAQVTTDYAQDQIRRRPTMEYVRR